MDHYVFQFTIVAQNSCGAKINNWCFLWPWQRGLYNGDFKLTWPTGTKE